MKGATGFALGILTGAVCVLLVMRLRAIVESEEGFDELSGRITDHLAELEERAAAAQSVGA
ncbi:MAG: hypothetical protein WAO58_03375 [Fimbriimonadaceae bacterium]